eukprot:TRINITY_DN8618_c0_g1_i1.p1 TRINITY_DN8618_c0_g1~~TRINITY_DN8618_c0_g1_i1.p1  ORF type:complete len:482 (+),score=102.96 TRINITY_DN8618_c0_g1_i1:73-1518(+)
MSLRRKGFVYRPGTSRPESEVVFLPEALSNPTPSETPTNEAPKQESASAAAPNASATPAAKKPRGFIFRLPFPLSEALPAPAAIFSGKAPQKVRGFINRDNKCFLNVVVQSMVATPPFFNLITSIYRADESDSDYPTISRFMRFFKEFHRASPVPKSSLDVAGPGGKVNPWAAAAASSSSKPAPKPADVTSTSQLQVGSPMLPDMFYDLLKRFNPIASDWQEDSQEFFSFLLDVMHDELIHIKPRSTSGASSSSSSIDWNDEASVSDEWEEVGKKNKSAVVLTEKSSFPQSMITEIFGGELRSIVKKQGLKASASIQPFFCLHLDIRDDSVHSIEDALRLFMTSEKLDDFRDEGTQQNLIATKQNNVERLPRVLTLHLKRFAYTPFGTIEKVQKQISVSPVLKFQPSWLVHEKKYSPAERTYKLYSVISHWGQRAIGGHYTCDILQSNGDWMTFDDSNISKTTQEDVLKKPAYLLMYIRTD